MYGHHQSTKLLGAMNRRLTTYLLSCMLACYANPSLTLAQPPQMTQERYQLADETQLWRQSHNAAGLAIDMRDSSENRGVAYFDLSHQSGDYHRVQEGNQTNQLRFFTERYQKIGRYLYGYGSFDFDMGRTKERAWSDVLRSYNSDPFISGSSVYGKYDFQNFTLNAKLASVRLGQFNYGAALAYKVGDLSRLRDPRSRIRQAEYQVTPSATYATGQHTIGVAAWYHRYKEKLTGLKTIQTDPGLKYYVMSGLEYATGTTGGYNGYQREYVNHDFGGELSYAWQGSSLHSVNSVSLSHGTEYVYGQYKYEPGRYYTYHYGFTSRNRISKGRLLHSADAKVDYEQGYADQYNSQLITEHDGAYTTQRWERTMTFKKRYQLKKLDLSVHYRLSFTHDKAVAGYVGASYDLQTVSNKHLLATSQLEYGGSLLGLEGGYGFLSKRLWVRANANYRIKGKADLDLQNARTDHAQGVLLPDMAYYEANWWQGRLEVTYQLPLTIKRQRTLWFAKVYGQYLKTDNSLDSKGAGVSVGLYY